jgi:hypothetical protein
MIGRAMVAVFVAALLMVGAPDAMPDGGVYPLEQGATLLTPPPAT